MRWHSIVMYVLFWVCRRQVREDMTKTWKRIYEANYHKSLDHRSFYFKQAEKKNLLPKTLVSDVRDSAERRKQDERSLRSLSLSLAQRFEVAHTPDLTFDFKDRWDQAWHCQGWKEANEKREVQGHGLHAESCPALSQRFAQGLLAIQRQSNTAKLTGYITNKCVLLLTLT